MTNWEVLDDSCQVDILKNALPVGSYPKAATVVNILPFGNPLNPYSVDAVNIINKSIYGNIIPYDDVTINSGVPVSAADFQSQVQAFINSGCSGSDGNGLHITSADFSGSIYQNDNLIGLIASQNFDVWTDNKSGTLLLLGDGYTFDTATGEMTAPPDSYFILIYS